MKWREFYKNGTEILGLGVGDFVPWLKVVGNVAGGLAGGDQGASKADQEKAIQKALEQERIKQQAAKAEADAARTRSILYGVIGAVGVGGLVFVFTRRKS